MKILKRIAIGIVIFVLVIGAVATMIQRRFVFPRHFAHVPKTGSKAQENLDPISEPNFERFWISQSDSSRGEKTEVWIIKPSISKPLGLVYYMHGNGEVIDTMAIILSRYVQAGYVLVLPEYRGYGRSGGSPTAKGILSDYDQLYNLIEARPDFRGLPRIIHGRSLGGGFAAEFSMKHPPQIAIFESTFTSLRDRADDLGGLGFLLWDELNVGKFVKDFKGPMLILHGTQDIVVTIKHGRALHALNPQAEYKEFDAGHNTVFSSNGYWSTVLSFLNESTLKLQR